LPGAVNLLRQGRGRDAAAPVACAGLVVLHERASLALLGIGVTLPLFLLPDQASSPRLSDLALMFALPLIATRWRRLGAGLQAFCFGGVVLLAITAMLQMLQLRQTPNLPDMVFWFRWIAAVVAAAATAAVIVVDVERRRLFLTAVVMGAVCHLATYGLLELVGRERLEAVGLASPRAALTSVAAHVRITTLAEHPNAAMALIGLAVPACFAMPAHGMERRLLHGAAALIATIGFACTLSRGGTVAAALAALVFVMASVRRADGRNPLGLLVVICLLAGAGLAVQLTGWSLDGARFSARFEPGLLSDNIGGRAETWGRALSFVVHRPLGVGWSSPEELGRFRALTVSHNGYLFMARTVGLLAAAAMLALHCRSLTRLDAMAPLSAFVLAMMFSEDLTQGASFIFVACLTAALAFRRRLSPL
jgi:hypothetical protein